MSFQGSSSPILLVDDNVDDLFVLRQRVQRSGLPNPVVSFKDGEEAMAHLQRAITDKSRPLPAILFLDVRMPRCGGFEVLKWVRSQPALTGMEVVVVSSSSLPEDGARALQLGATRFLPKFPAPEIIAEIVVAAESRTKLEKTTPSGGNP